MESAHWKVAAIAVVAMWLLLPASLQMHAADSDEALIVECTRPCAAITAAVAAAGGVITQQFENVDAIAVRVPRSGVSSLVSLAGADSVYKDAEIKPPAPTEVAAIKGQVSEPLDAAAFAQGQPDNYNYNLVFTNVAPLHAAGQFGQNVVVAVIDSGTANVPQIPALAGSVIGGETFVPAAQDPLSATHRENGSHGTMTAEMVAAHAVFLFLNASPFVQALNRYARVVRLHARRFRTIAVSRPRLRPARCR